MTRMIDSLPSLGALRAFHAVADAGGFSAAAKVLHVTQSAVSHRVRGLEDVLGTPLFQRRGSRISLTVAGEVLYRATSDAFARLERGVVELERRRDDQTVSVSCSPSFAIRWLVPHLALLRHEAPAIDVRISADDRVIHPGTMGVDLCVRFGPGDYHGCLVEQLTCETIRAVCSPLYRSAHAIDSPSTVLRATLLHADVLLSHPSYVGWAEWLAAAGVSGEPSEAVHFSHAHMAIVAAIAGQGVALGRTTLTREALRAGQLVTIAGPELESGFHYWLVRPKRELERAAVRDFAEWLTRVVRECEPDEQEAPFMSALPVMGR